MSLKKLASSSLGRKYFMAVSGLALIGFLFTHLLGNALLFLGPDLFNEYSHALTSNPLIYVAEAILLTIFFVHILTAILLTKKNKEARGEVAYLSDEKAGGKSRKSLSSSTMIYSGVVILIFLVYHIYSVKYGAYYATMIEGVEVRDIYRLLIEELSNPVVLTGYIIAMLLLGMHLAHAFSSALQSMGFNHSRYNKQIMCAGKAIAFGLSAGFILVAVYAARKGGLL